MNGDHWLLYLTPPQDDVLAPNALESSKALAPSNPTVPLADLSASLSSNLTSPSLASSSATTYFPSPAARRPLAPAHTTSNSSTASSVRAHRPDQTLEILMSQLHPSACAAFYHPSSNEQTEYKSPLYPSDAGDADAHALGQQLSERLGISALMPDATLDAFLFSPCGYSANAVLGDRYATIHVTPEEAYSYASFECNLDFVEEVPARSLLQQSPQQTTVNGAHGGGGGVLETVKGSAVQKRGPQSMQELIEQVLAIFKPAKLSITLFVSVDEDDEDQTGNDQARGGAAASSGMVQKPLQLLSPALMERYNRVDRIGYTYDGYVLTYCVFEEKQGLR